MAYKNGQAIQKHREWNGMNYAQTLKKLTDEAPPASWLTREQLEAALAAITQSLKGPMSDGERLILCEDRSSRRKALAALNT
jgi:predicted unusual protein kinase regulating ubiquinone biosynthesis (AarF/ABC1/UbiB family)